MKTIQLTNKSVLPQQYGFVGTPTVGLFDVDVKVCHVKDLFILFFFFYNWCFIAWEIGNSDYSTNISQLTRSRGLIKIRKKGANKSNFESGVSALDSAVKFH